MAPCSLLALLPTLSNTLSSGSHLLVSARLLPAMRLAALLQTRAWTSRQLPPALTGPDLTSAPAGPHGSETEVLLRCPHNTLHSISPPEMAYLPCHIPLGFDSHGMNSSPRVQCSLRFAPCSLFLSPSLLLTRPRFFSASSPPRLALPAYLMTLHLKIP